MADQNLVGAAPDEDRTDQLEFDDKGEERQDKQGEMLLQNSIFIIIDSVLLLCQRRGGENEETTRDPGN